MAPGRSERDLGVTHRQERCLWDSRSPQDGTREEPAFLTWCSQEEASVPEQPASCRRRAHPGAVSLRGGGSFAQGPVWLRSGPEPLHLGLLTGCLTCHVGRTCGPQR